MTDDKSTEDNTQKTTRRRPRTRWIVMGIAGALVMAIAGTTWSTAGFTKRGGHDFGWFAERKIDRMLDEVEATDDQRGRVHEIVKAAVADLQEARSLKREIRQDLIASLTMETIDRNELETLRLRKMETVDQHEPAHAHRARRRGRGADACPAPGTRGGMEVTQAPPQARP